MAVEQLITLQELEELLDVTIANYHCTPHDGLNGRTPLEALRQALDHHAVPSHTPDILALSTAPTPVGPPLYRPRQRRKRHRTLCQPLWRPLQ